MFGFVFGIAAALAAGHVYRRWRSAGVGFDGSAPHDGRPYLLRWLSQRLRLTLAQDKVFDEVTRDVFDSMATLKGSMRDGFGDLAQVLRGADGADLATTWAAQDAALSSARERLKVNLDRLTQALDPEQREVLADLVERRCGASRDGGAGGDHGGGYGGGRGGYRGHAFERGWCGGFGRHFGRGFGRGFACRSTCC